MREVFVKQEEIEDIKRTDGVLALADVERDSILREGTADWATCCEIESDLGERAGVPAEFWP